MRLLILLVLVFYIVHINSITNFKKSKINKDFTAINMSWDGVQDLDPVYQSLMGFYDYDESQEVFISAMSNTSVIQPTNTAGTIWKLNFDKNEGYLLLYLYKGRMEGSHKNRVYSVRNGIYNAEPGINAVFLKPSQIVDVKKDQELTREGRTHTTHEKTRTSCHLGYIEVCTTESQHPDMREVCPAAYGVQTRSERAGECTCLPTRGVEQDIAEGISPLGSNIHDCVHVRSDLFPQQETADMMETMMDEWKIKEFSIELKESFGENEDTMQRTLMNAMKKEMDHEVTVQTAGYLSKFIRSTDRTDTISHNFRIMKTLEMEVEKASNGQREWRSNINSFRETCQALNRNLETESSCKFGTTCIPENNYRSFSGCCNNIENNKMWGSENEPMISLLPPEYHDRQSLPRGGLDPSSLPGARQVSSTVFSVAQTEPSPHISLMVMQFGQFLDHDFTLTPEPELKCCDPSILAEDQKLHESLRQCFNIKTTNDLFFSEKKLFNAENCMPFSRSDAVCSDSEVRQQFNANTAFIDASMVYGSNEKTAKMLRKMSGGQLKMHSGPSLPILPTRKQCAFNIRGEQQPEDLVSGDVRTIEQPGLASMHTLFFTEHNLIANEVNNLVEWSDEEIYQYTRKIVGAEIQNIAFNEFLPIVLGSETMELHSLRLPEDKQQDTKYNPHTNPTIFNEFATAAFRFGHSLIPNMYLIPSQTPIRSSNRCPLMGNFFQFQEWVIGDDTSGKAWPNLLWGIAEQQSPAMDASINNNLLDFLFCDNEHELCNIPGGFGQDLGARNIQRGRDHGIPGYNKYRELCGIEKITSLTEEARPSNINTENWKNIIKAYENNTVDDIDLFVGGLAEDSLPGALIGQTFACIIGRQFARLKDGDRFFFTHENSRYTKGLSPPLREYVRTRTLGHILCQHRTGLSSIPVEVMRLGSEWEPCPEIHQLREAISKDLLGHQLFPVDALQSSTHTCDGCSGGPAKFCIDSNLTTVCHTRHFEERRAPWVALDFAASITVTAIEIVNFDWNRVGAVEVRVTNTLPTDANTMFSGGELFGSYTPGTERLEAAPKQGRFVLIQRHPGQFPDDVLIMTEIRVFGFSGNRNCPEGWLMFKGKCYGLPKNNLLGWSEAESFCQSWSAGAHLASIHSSEEQKFVQENFPRDIWLGGSDGKKEGTWVWSDGEPWVYSDWRSGQPDDHGPGEDCLQGNWADLQWNDGSCPHKLLFLCKT